MFRKLFKSIIQVLAKSLVCILCFLAIAPILLTLTLGGNKEETVFRAEDTFWMDQYDELVADALSDAREGALSVTKRFWINENAKVLPPRDPTKYGTASDASELQWLLEEAASLLDGQETLFSTDIEIREGTEITYYLDESIFAVTWQQVLNRMVYTIAEVKISDPSQFRRHVSDGIYGLPKVYTTTQLSAQAGAVIASSADHYLARTSGIVVYDGEVKRFTGAQYMDVCFVNRDGDLILKPAGTFREQEELEQFVSDHNVKFSFSFGPIMIQDGVRCEPDRYSLGEINDGYPRCAICQKDDLHYLMVTANGNGPNTNYPTVSMFADQIEQFGVRQAYTLDGGQTGAIVMEDRLLNPTEYKTGQRLVCDILFFATAVPEKSS